MLKSVFIEAVKRNIILEKDNPMKNIEESRSRAEKINVRGLTIKERTELVKILNQKNEFDKFKDLINT